jgi:hypothetical protein
MRRFRERNHYLGNTWPLMDLFLSGGRVGHVRGPMIGGEGHVCGHGKKGAAISRFTIQPFHPIHPRADDECLHS